MLKHSYETYLAHEAYVEQRDNIDRLCDDIVIGVEAYNAISSMNNTLSTEDNVKYSIVLRSLGLSNEELNIALEEDSSGGEIFEHNMHFIREYSMAAPRIGNADMANYYMAINYIAHYGQLCLSVIDKNKD